VGKGVEEWFERISIAKGVLYSRESVTGALPEMQAWVGAWNRTVHSFTSNWRELRTVAETLKREEVVFDKLREKNC
jgi:hypothetical protein